MDTDKGMVTDMDMDMGTDKVMVMEMGMDMATVGEERTQRNSDIQRTVILLTKMTVKLVRKMTVELYHSRRASKSLLMFHLTNSRQKIFGLCLN
jgi:hypothetical protein